MVEVLDSDDDFIETPHRSRTTLQPAAQCTGILKAKTKAAPLSRAGKRLKAVCSASKAVANDGSTGLAALEPAQLAGRLSSRGGNQVEGSCGVTSSSGAPTGSGDIITISDSEDGASDA